MSSQKLLLKVAQVATVEKIAGCNGITRLVLKDGTEVKVRVAESGVRFGLSVSHKEQYMLGFDDLQKAADKLSRWKNAPERANWLAVDGSSGRAYWYIQKPEYDAGRGVWESESTWIESACRNLEIAGSKPKGLEGRPTID